MRSTTDRVSGRARAVPVSLIRRMFDLTPRVPGAVSLAVGEPGFPTPPHIVEAATKALRDGYTKYSPNPGYLDLREAIAERTERVHGYRVDPAREVFVTVGAMQALAVPIAEDTRRIRLELGEAHQIMRDLQLRLHGVDLRLSGLQRLLRLLVICPRGPTLLEKRVLAFEMIACLGQLALSGREIGLRRPQCIQLVLRFETRHHLPGLQAIPELAVAFDDPARDAECEGHFVFRFNAAGQGDGNAGFASLDGYGPDRSDFRVSSRASGPHAASIAGSANAASAINGGRHIAFT